MLNFVVNIQTYTGQILDRTLDFRLKPMLSNSGNNSIAIVQQYAS